MLIWSSVEFDGIRPVMHSTHFYHHYIGMHQKCSVLHRKDVTYKELKDHTLIIMFSRGTPKYVSFLFLLFVF